MEYVSNVKILIILKNSKENLKFGNLTPVPVNYAFDSKVFLKILH